MILLIHGNDPLSARKYFLSLRDEGSIILDAEHLNLIELAQISQGSGLFIEPKKIFIDNLFTKKGFKNIEQVANIINENENLEVYLFADKEVEAKNQKYFKKLEIKQFKIPQNIWNFLGSIKPGNKSSLLMFHKTLEETEVEIVFSMMIRQFRLLLGISSNTKENIDEVKRMAPWQKSRLTSQASLFSTEQLKSIYKELFEIEKNTKTGRSKLTLRQNIDILLADI